MPGSHFTRDAEGRLHTSCLHLHGFPRMLRDVLRMVGHVGTIRYIGQEVPENGFGKYEVCVIIPPHKDDTNRPGMEVKVYGEQMEDLLLEEAAQQAMLEFCEQYIAELGDTPLALLPVRDQMGYPYFSRISRVTARQHRDYNPNFAVIAEFAVYMFNLHMDHREAARLRRIEGSAARAHEQALTQQVEQLTAQLNHAHLEIHTLQNQLQEANEALAVQAQNQLMAQMEDDDDDDEEEEDPTEIQGESGAETGDPQDAHGISDAESSVNQPYMEQPPPQPSQGSGRRFSFRVPEQQWEELQAALHRHGINWG